MLLKGWKENGADVPFRRWTSIKAEIISSFGAFILKAVIQRYRGHSEIIYGVEKVQATETI